MGVGICSNIIFRVPYQRHSYIITHTVLRKPYSIQAPMLRVFLATKLEASGFRV